MRPGLAGLFCARIAAKSYESAMRAPEPLLLSFEKFFLDLMSEVDPDLLDPMVAIKLGPVIKNSIGVAYSMGFSDGSKAK